MNAPLRLSLLILLLPLLASCQNAVFAPSLLPDAQSAVVYLYRPAAESAGLAKPLRHAWPEVLLDEQPVGTLGYDRYLSFRVGPGEHTLRVTGLTPGARFWELEDREYRLSARAGEAYFLRLKVAYNLAEMQLGHPKPSYLYWLTPVERQDAQYEIRHTRETR